MRLSFKIALAFVAGMAVLLILHGLSRVQYATALLRRDAQTDHRAIGRTLAVTVGEAWERSGAAEAAAITEQVNRARSNVSIRLVPLPARAADAGPRFRIEAGTVAALRRGQEVQVVVEDAGADGRALVTYVPVRVTGALVGTIELREALSEEHRFVRDIVVRTIITGAAIAIVSALLALGLGYLMVGRPVRRLIEKARRIGAGDFSGHLQLARRDELSDLASEMNAMSDLLAEARRRLTQESESKIAAVEQLRHADKLMSVGQLAAGMAHEVGTPLNVIAGRAKMITRGELSADEVTESARIITEQAERIHRLIRHLMDFARRRAPQKTRVDLQHVAAKTVDLLAPLAKRREVSVTLADPDSPVVAEVDPDQLQQVLTNLLMNGVDAARSGGRVSVQISRESIAPPSTPAGPRREVLCISVSDDGEGIPADVVPRVFEPFFTTKEVGRGTGLGLSVSFGIVQEHGGWIGVDSQPGQGSRFTVCLPEGEA